jgi:hypothetical protein
MPDSKNIAKRRKKKRVSVIETTAFALTSRGGEYGHM